MKKLVIHGVATSTLVATLLCSAVGAESVSSLNLRQNLFATCFVDDNEGWSVGDLGRIFHTVDGGKNWEVQSAETKRPFVSIACPDKTHVWIAGQAGQIAFSGDGGATWKLQNSGVPRNLLSIAFANASRGIAVGDFGILLHTEDGGATWTKVPLPTDVKLPPDIAEVVDPGDVVLSSATFGGPDAAWVSGEFGVILNSLDGGKTWQQQPSTVEATLFDISFADTQRGWAVGIDATMLSTTDGGATWHKQIVETPKGFTLPLYEIEVRGNYGWAIGNSGLLLSSKDSGLTWQLIDLPVRMASSWFRGVSLLADGHGFLVGARGLVVATDRDKVTPLKENL